MATPAKAPPRRLWAEKGIASTAMTSVISGIGELLLQLNLQTNGIESALLQVVNVVASSS